MTDEEITYASVTFKANKQSQFTAEKEVEIVYDEVKVSRKNPPGANRRFLQDKVVGIRSRLSQLVHHGCGIPCGFLLLLVIGLSVYFSLCSARATDELSQLRTNQTKLLENSRKQTHLHSTLLADCEHLRKDHTNLTELWSNLKDSFMNLHLKIQNLSAQNQHLMTQNEELKKENANLKLQKDDMEMEWNKLNGSRVQWSIDAYCPKEKRSRHCQACQKMWKHMKNKCYDINKRTAITWKQAQQDCERKNSQLILHDEVTKNHFPQVWLGLSVENGKWKWINGSTLSDSSLSISPAHGHCAVSDRGKDWKSVNCNNIHYWICEKEALSL